MKKFAYRVWKAICPIKQYQISFCIRCITGTEKNSGDHNQYLYKSVLVWAYSRSQARKRAEIAIQKLIKTSFVQCRRI